MNSDTHSFRGTKDYGGRLSTGHYISNFIIPVTYSNCFVAPDLDPDTFTTLVSTEY
jgi:hypothetical protein